MRKVRAEIYLFSYVQSGVYCVDFHGTHNHILNFWALSVPSLFPQILMENLKKTR
jgi:hypothetical protein